MKRNPLRSISLTLPVATVMLFAVFVWPVAAAIKPFDVFDLPPVELGPGEAESLPVLIDRDTSTCTQCLPNSPGAPQGTETCCTTFVCLTLEGTPPGVTGIFEDGECTLGDNSLLLSVDQSVAAGVYTLTVVGTALDGPPGGRVDHGTLTLTVQPFSLSLPSELVAQPGSTATAPVNISRIASFTDPVDLELTSVNPPTSGITGSFSPDLVFDNNSGLTVNVAGSVAPGTYLLTVTGTGGGVSRAKTLSLKVPSFSLSLSPSNLVLVSGSTATVTVGLTREAGFTGAVAFQLTSPTSGITGSFSPSLARGSSSQLALNAAGSVPAGTYTLTVRGT